MRKTARRKRGGQPNGVKDYRHDEARRKNNPPVGIASAFEVRRRETTRYSYDPHLDPQLQWAGKAEHTSFEIDVVSLHVHERISTRAILDAVRRPEPLQLTLFGEPALAPHQQIEFYQHEVGWANRLVLGDSLLVMNSLLVKEGMAGKVQMIYVDPPYGIKYASNFQPRIDRRDVKDTDEDLTHEPEQIKAYRDTWKLGVHSYLTYLRDRLLLCRELLHESGSIFVQIGEENVHRVRGVADEVFGSSNLVTQIPFVKTGAQTDVALPTIVDYLLWYAKDKSHLKIRPLFLSREVTRQTFGQYPHVELRDGTRRPLTAVEKANPAVLPDLVRFYQLQPLHSQHFSKTRSVPFVFRGHQFEPPVNRQWATSIESLERLASLDRIEISGRTIRYIRYFDDFIASPLPNVWVDTSTFEERLFAAQTPTKVIERCILMTTDPGDLVFDPTCGSGTTAYCAEKWGRRWITCDTSRVALAIARQRLMTAKFDYYELKDPERGPAGGFIYETVPHITLESIAKNTEIDAIAARYQPQIEEALAELNRALGKNWKEWEVPREVPHTLWPREAQEAYWKLYESKRKAHSADAPQLQEWLQTVYRLTGHLWESLDDVPEPIPAADWPEEAKAALRRFWELKRRKRREIDESIQRNAPQETLYDRPRVVRGVVRVSGPFTVEAIPVPAVEDPSQAPIPRFEEEEAQARIAERGGDYLADMINLLKQQGGILFPGGKKMELQNPRPLNLGYLHAEAEAQQNGKTLRVAVSFGPQYGPVTALQVQETIPTAKVNGYGVLIFAGFSFDSEAHALLQKSPVAGVQVYFANIAPDVLVGDLLKTTRASQIFTVFGQPDVHVGKGKDGTFTVELRGVDFYDPLTGEAGHAKGSEVAAWFLDTDYDGMTFHVSQAFFPGDSDAWERLQRALKAQIDPETFEKMRGTSSFPFKPGDHKRVAVKVIDFRGNEAMRVVKLEDDTDVRRKSAAR